MFDLSFIFQWPTPENITVTTQMLGCHLFHPWKTRTLYWWIRLPIEATKWDPARKHQWVEVSNTSHYSITANACHRGMPQQHITIMDTREAQGSIVIITVIGVATVDVTATWYNAAMDTVILPRWTFTHLMVSYNHGCQKCFFVVVVFSFFFTRKTEFD